MNKWLVSKQSVLPLINGKEQFIIGMQITVEHDLVLFTKLHTPLETRLAYSISLMHSPEINRSLLYEENSWLKLLPNPQKGFEIVE